ncbi:MAG: ribose-phosphate pyrophosphokinase [Eggerthellaceae bacterium]|jgi:ribose-phosphate pyrophosphokinase|nr:ribose-phosphate pyrophosphokinase [Eggerthellaceae bacterium]MDR2721268.1 ribose-phosphate pyrophosphokinase [Coriobacteriaceae bacterium]
MAETTEMKKSLAIFSGSVNRELAEEVAKHLNMELGKMALKQFSNGEIYARYLESIRGADVFIIQSVAGGCSEGDDFMDVNDALMELLIMTDAAKRASARTVTAVISNYGYSRQDRKAAAREPITAKLVANLLTVAGVDRTITIDLHQGQIQGFFDTPVNHLTALPILAAYFKKKNLDRSRLCIVSPDVGRAKAAKKFSDVMDADLVIMHKGRPSHNKAEITALIGDVRDKICIINDDMIDTAGTLIAAAETLKQEGADMVYVCATHPIFSGPAYERLENSDIEEVVVCNTIPVPQQHLRASNGKKGKITMVSVAPLLAEAIWNVYSDGSVSQIFDSDYSL